MSDILLPISRELVEFNQHWLEKMGNHLCRNKAMVVCTVGQENGKIYIATIDGLPPSQLAGILEDLAARLRAGQALTSVN